MYGVNNMIYLLILILCTFETLIKFVAFRMGEVMDMFSFVQSESPQVFDSGLKLDIFQGEIDNVMYHGG